MKKASQSALSVTFWGVRGSFPSTGTSTRRFGGNTPCVEIRLGERLFIIDAGTGLIALGRHIAPKAPPIIDILLSHLHLDHTTGLAFFAPAFNKASTIRTWTGNLDGASAKAALDRLFAPPLFPVTLDQFPARFEHHGFKAGCALAFEDGSRIATLALKHPSGATGYRLENQGRSVCYISDIEHDEPWPNSALVDFVRECDLLIFDAMFTSEEYSRCIGWGHSTIEAGLALAAAAKIGDFAAFHHNPAHADTVLAKRERQLKAKRARAFFAREGMTITYPPRKSRS